MLIVMRQGASEEEVARVEESVRAAGFTPHPVRGALRTAVAVTGNETPLNPASFERLAGVQSVVPVTQPTTLVGRESHPDDTLIEVGGAVFGGGHLAVIAGPCAVESFEQTLEVARAVQAAGAKLLRGGAYKPRTSPYSFQGLEREGLKILSKVRQETGLPVVTEVLDTDSLELVAEHADVIQIGARSMQNFPLLKRAGRVRKPVLLKRGLSATLEEWLMSAEYIAAEGNPSIILCERGVRTFSTHTRYTLDLAIVPAVKETSHLPVIVDPSHGTGSRTKVAPMARAAVAAGADGLMVEVHADPGGALSDGPQALLPSEFAGLMAEVRALAGLAGRKV